MAATKYQVLYRYINESTNTPITNSTEDEYKVTREFYTDPHHKIFFDNDLEAQADATDEQQELISYGNSSDNPKNNMLFAYDGTKKVKHPQWIPETTGYVVRDWKKIKRSLIGNQGDFTKEFTTLDAATPEDGGTVVCTEPVFKKYFPKEIIVADQGSYTSQQIQNDVINATIFKIKENLTWKDHATPSPAKLTYYKNSYQSYEYFDGPVLVDMTLGSITGYSYAQNTPIPIKGNLTNEGLYLKVTIKHEQIETTTIPGHYAEAMDPPYLIIDTYKRIKLSPWFVSCTSSSLEGAISKARVLIEMLGIENVKLIKIVPFDQFIKIK